MATTTIVPPATVAPASPMGRRVVRMQYLDNLRVILVAAVIVTHATLIYGPGGGWIYHEGHVGPATTLVLGSVGLLGGLFWLGLFFLVAGMLSPGSLARHGRREFSRERVIRLGTPLVLYVVLIMPLLHYAVANFRVAHPASPWRWLAHHLWPLDPGPLWFVAALLFISATYAVWWGVRPQMATPPTVLSSRYLVFLAGLIAVLTFLVRIVFPMDTHQFLGAHLWQWPQYVVLFWFGAISFQRGWLTAVPDRLWKRCGVTVAVCAAIGIVFIVAIAAGAIAGQEQDFQGGLHWQALVPATVEGVLAIAAPVWLLEFFRRYVDRPFPLAPQLIRGSYGAYVLQAPVLIVLALLLQLLVLPVQLKLVILAPAGIAGSFALAYLATRVRVLNRIL